MPTTPERSPLTQPQAADLVLEFANTRAGARSEQFVGADGLRDWLSDMGFPDDGVTDADAASAREFRSALQTLMLSHAGDEDTPAASVTAAEDYLRRLAVRYPLICVVTANGVSLEAPHTGMLAAFASVLAGINELARTDVWARLKACRNPICHEGFFDRSRNASAIYHGPQCSSMVSMRAYRQRKKEASP